ncbi:zinc finger protein 572 isoform X1 [Folsomia candida]|uniref:zinc finger protein 572 isoform X1 n=1 Tax=Folsomia candida TaxID=158441 RepID=UPI000B906308|nr:zinc finger protein 572 isoform X1 [Folsomia candida]
MSKDNGLSKNGTRHILQDLLCSTVRLQRTNFLPPTQYDHRFSVKIEGDISSPELRSCSICSESINLRPLALQEMEVLAKFVLSQEQISLILQTDDHPPILCCKICSSVILSLAKLSTQIENITISLRAVISSRNGLFHKLRNESKISATDNNSPAEQIPQNDDDDQQLTGWIEVEEEFSVKVEPITDNIDDKTGDPTPDPLYEPDTSESEDGDSDSDPVIANSDVKPESKFACKICLPNVTFSRGDHYRRYVENKNIHPDISDSSFARVQARLASKKFACDECDKRFTYLENLLRHMRNKNIHPDISDAEIAAVAKKNFTNCEPFAKPELKFECKICQPNVTFLRYHNYKGHMTDKKIHPPAAIKRAKRLKKKPYPCPKSTKRFTSCYNLNRHKQTFHDLAPFQRKCTLCPEVFNRFFLFERHMRKCHDVPVEASSSKEERHSCAICPNIFSSSSNKTRHVELAHFPDKTSCPYGCETKIVSEAAWVKHLEGCDSPKTSKESEITCRFCPAVFRDILLEIEHRLRVHPKQTCTCSICKARFTRQSILNDHRCPG